jgi:hypothetical protein
MHKKCEKKVWTKILELWINYGQSNKTIYTGLDHWYSKCCHISWHYDKYRFVIQENNHKSKMKHNKHFIQNTIKYNKTNS